MPVVDQFGTSKCFFLSVWEILNEFLVEVLLVIEFDSSVALLLPYWLAITHISP